MNKIAKGIVKGALLVCAASLVLMCVMLFVSGYAAVVTFCIALASAVMAGSLVLCRGIFAWIDEAWGG